MLTDCQSSFTGGHDSKFHVKWILTIQPRLKSVDTLFYKQKKLAAKRRSGRDAECARIALAAAAAAASTVRNLPVHRFANAVLAVVSSVCLSVCSSQAGTVPKRLNIGSRKQRCTIDKGL